MKALPDVSLVVPVFREEANIRPLVEGVRDALMDWRSWELLFVDDHSDDSTPNAVRTLAAEDPRIRLLALTRRYGQATAMQAGFDHARAEIVVTMDGDLQNDPCDIPALVEELEKGYDLVAGYRQARKDRLLTRRVPSWVANRLITWMTGVEIRDNGCSLKAYRKPLLDRMRLYSDLHRFIPALAVGAAGARISQISVRHHARVHGKSKYGLSRIGKVLIDLLTVKVIRSLRANPLRPFAGVAASSAFAGLFFASLAVGMSAAGSGGESEPSVVFTGVSLLCFSFAVFLMMLGLVAQSAVAVTGESRPPSTPLLRQVSP